jgi:hypothetical protein
MTAVLWELKEGLQIEDLTPILSVFINHFYFYMLSLQMIYMYVQYS